MSAETYTVRCWNCLNDFEAVEAVWCSCDPKHPSKLCPFCLHCFCPADDATSAVSGPPRRARSRTRSRCSSGAWTGSGEILIRNQKLKTPQLLQALREQERTGGLLGKILIQKGWVTQQDIDDALKYQGYQPLVDSQGLELTPAPQSATGNPAQLLEYLLTLAARKGASDIHLEPSATDLTIKLRIDGLFYKVKPLASDALVPLLQRIQEVFSLDPRHEDLPQKGRAHLELEGHDFDLLVTTLPTRMGTSVTIKLVDRRFFLKNFTALGLTPADQLFLVRALDSPSGLHHGHFAALQRRHDHFLLLDGSGSEVREAGREHRARHPVGSALRPPDGGEPGQGARFRGRAAVGREHTTGRGLHPRAQRQGDGEPRLPARDDASRHHHVSCLRRCRIHLPLPRARRASLRSSRGVSPSSSTSVWCAESARTAATREARRTRKSSARTGSARRKPRPCGSTRDGAATSAIVSAIGAGRDFSSSSSSTLTSARSSPRDSTLAEIEASARGAGMESLRQRCLKEVTAGVTSLDEFIRWRM